LKLLHFFLILTLISALGCKVQKKQPVKARNANITILQSKNGGDKSTMEGYVKSNDDKQPVEFVNVVLKQEGRVIAGCVTDLDGYFKIKDLSNGTYNLQVQGVGYQTIDVQFVIKKASSYNIEVNIELQVSEVLKPVLYLYPKTKTDISIQLNYDGKITHSYPTYTEQGWHVTATPDGTLFDNKGTEYYALFWEGVPKKPIVPQDGFVVPGNETAAFLEEKLAYLGLNRREANEFIMFWLPRLENNPYNLIHFAGKTYEEQSQLVITPQPETMIRVMMLTQPLSHKIDVPTQDLSALKKVRKGYTAVEWGGSEVMFLLP
jgi:hypothetical protein